METQQQLLSGEALVSQTLPSTAQDASIVLLTSSRSYGDHDSGLLNSSDPTPSGADLGSPASVIVPVNLKVVERRANGSEGIDFSLPPPPPPDSPCAAVAEDGDTCDPEGGTCTKKRRGGGWITTPFIFGAEAGERLAVTGSHANLITYLVNEMHQKTLQSATIINTFSSTSAWAPLLGAFVADSYLGRYATILYGSFIYLAGLILITMSAVMPSLQPAPCEMPEDRDQVSSSCVPATSLQIGVVYIALSLMVVGSGGIRPCVSPFGASQFDQNDPKENVQLKSYFNWYFFSVTVAGLFASTIIVYIQDNVSWGLGFGISAAVMVLSIISFAGGSFLYRFSSPQGSAFTRMAQVLVAAARKRRLKVPSDSNLLYYGSFEDDDALKLSICNSPENSKELSDFNFSPCNEPVVDSKRSSRKVSTVSRKNLSVAGRELNEKEMLMMERDRPSFLQNSRQFRFLDKAAIELETDRVPEYNLQGEITSNEVNPWRLCPVRQVEELKSIIRLMPMWATGVVTGLAVAQVPTYLVQQARTMNRDIGGFNIPPASMSVISTITIIVWLPFFDRFLVPRVIAPRTGHPRGFTYLQKIGIGYALHILTVAISILVEHERRLTAKKYGFLDKPNEVIPFSAFSLVPQELVAGVASCFSFIGHYEFYYHMVPEHITSTASALSQTSFALGTLLASALLNAVQRATESPGHPGWLDEDLNRAHLDYFYTIVLFLQSVNLTVYIFIISKWYRKHLIRN